MGDHLCQEILLLQESIQSDILIYLEIVQVHNYEMFVCHLLTFLCILSNGTILDQLESIF